MAGGERGWRIRSRLSSGGSGGVEDGGVDYLRFGTIPLVERSSTARRTSWCAREDRRWLDGDGIVRGGGDRRRKVRARFRRLRAPRRAKLRGEDEDDSAKLVTGSAWLRELPNDGDVAASAMAARPWWGENQESERGAGKRSRASRGAWGACSPGRGSREGGLALRVHAGTTRRRHGATVRVR